MAHTHGDIQARQMAVCALRAEKKRRAFAQAVGVDPIWVDPVVVDVVRAQWQAVVVDPVSAQRWR